MGGLGGNLILLESASDPKVRLKIPGMEVDYSGSHKHFFGNYLLAITSSGYTLWNGYIPFIIDLERNLFSFLDHCHGYAFQFVYTSPNIITSIQKPEYKVDLYKRYDFNKLDGRKYELDKLEWFPFSALENPEIFSGKLPQIK